MNIVEAILKSQDCPMCDNTGMIIWGGSYAFGEVEEPYSEECDWCTTNSRSKYHLIQTVIKSGFHKFVFEKGKENG